MRMILLTILLASSSWAQQASLPEQPGAPDAVDSVLAAQGQMLKAMLDGEIDRFLALLSRGFVALDPSNTVRRYDDLAAVLISGRLRYDSIDDDIVFTEQLDDDLVVVMGRETTRQSAVPVEGALEQTALDNALVRQYTNVFRREGDTWRLLIKQSSIVTTER